MTNIKVDASYLNPLFKTMKVLERKLLGIKSIPKDVPMWLPNGEEIKTLQEMAAMLNTDVKTASYCILDSKNAPKLLRLEASYEVKEIIKHVRTPAGAEKYGEPIGSIIKLDEHGHVLHVTKPNSHVMSDVADGGKQPPLPDMPVKVKPPKRKHNVIVRKPSDNRVALRDLNGRSFNALDAQPIPLKELPKKKFTQMGGRNWEDVNPKERKHIESMYGDLMENGDGWQGNSSAAKQLKANVQHNISQRILGHSLTDPELQRWADAKMQTLFLTNNPVGNVFSLNSYEYVHPLPPHEMSNRLTFLKDLGMVDENATVDEVSGEDSKYEKFLNGGAGVRDMFTSTQDRETIMRYALLVEAGLVDDYQRMKNNKDGTWLPREGTFYTPTKDMANHSTNELLFLHETRELIGQWASTSGDTHADAIAMQLSVKDAFSLDDASTEHLDKRLTEAAKIAAANGNGKPYEMEPFRQAFIKAVYEDTQDFFKANKIKNIDVYRGMRFEGEKSDIPNWANPPELQKHKDKNIDKYLEKEAEYVDQYVEDNYNDADANAQIFEAFRMWFSETRNSKPYIDNILKDKNRSKYYSDTYKKAMDNAFGEWHKNNETGQDSVIQGVKDQYTEDLKQKARNDFAWETNSGDSDLNLENAKSSEFVTDGNAVLQPISSWSIDQSEASNFAGNSYTHGMVLHSAIPVERIFSTSFSGLGCLSEGEIVVLGGKLDTEMTFL